MTEHYLSDALSDWTAINTCRRLRGALLYAARLARRHGDNDLASGFENRVSRLSGRRLSKEAINCVLFSACAQAGMF